MYVFYADDSKQRAPSRNGMSGGLVAVGGIRVPEENIRYLENKTNEICSDYGFPDGEEFKWSPPRDFWMYTNLVAEQRENFFKDVLSELINAHVKSTVVIVDTSCAAATNAESAEMDATKLFLERAGNCLDDGCRAIVIADRPGGGRNEEEAFLDECIGALKDDTNYTQPEKIAAILSTSSHLTRLLQCADLVTGSTLSHICGGAPQYSTPIFNVVKQTFTRGCDSIGGIGLKLHPDIKYRNLYHWLLGDTLFWKHNRRHRLPQAGKPYFADENTV